MQEALTPPSETRDELEPSVTPAVRGQQASLLVGTYPPASQELFFGIALSNITVLPAPQISCFQAHMSSEARIWLLEAMTSTNGTLGYAQNRLVNSRLLHSGTRRFWDKLEIRLGLSPSTGCLVFADRAATDTPPLVSLNEQCRQDWIESHSVPPPLDHYGALLALYRHVSSPCSYWAYYQAINQECQVRNRPAYAELDAPDVAQKHPLIQRLRARVEVDPKHHRLIPQIARMWDHPDHAADPCVD